jgi:hypothetical protein
MFTKNIFTKKDPIADLIKDINEADYNLKVEQLRGKQHKIDANKNGEIDSDDFKILRGKKKVDEAGSPFDKDYKSQVATKPGEKAGFDSKKVSTGTVYSRKPPKPEPTKEEIKIDRTMSAHDHGYEYAFSGIDDAKTKGEVHRIHADSLEDNPHPKGSKEHKEWDTGARKAKVDHLKDWDKPVTIGYTKEEVEPIDEATTVVGKATKTGADKKGQELGAVSASVEGVKTEHEHEGKKYTVHSGVDRDGDVHHSVIHDGKQVHNHLVTQDGTYGDKPSPLHKKLIDDHVTSAKKHLDKMAGHIFSDEDDEDDMRESYENLGEAELSAAEVAKKEKLVKSMKKGMAGFKERYGKRWKDVMYATATARAKKNK